MLDKRISSVKANKFTSCKSAPASRHQIRVADYAKLNLHLPLRRRKSERDKIVLIGSVGTVREFQFNIFILKIIPVPSDKMLTLREPFRFKIELTLN